MWRSFLGTTAVLLAAGVLLCWPGTSFAVPTPGPDCGAGASIVGADTAGKVTLGTGRTTGTCTITFSSAFVNTPSCMAMNETNSMAGRPVPVGARSTNSQLVLDGATIYGGSLSDGDVLSYLCVSY